MDPHAYDMDGRWHAARPITKVMYTGTPLLPYMVVELPRTDWATEDVMTKLAARAPRFRTHWTAATRQTLGGVVIRAGQRLAGSIDNEALLPPTTDVTAVC